MKLLHEADWVADYCRENGFTYGDAPINPAINCDAKNFSCDRLVEWALYRAGYTDQPYSHGLVVYDESGSRDLSAYCEKLGFEKITDKKELLPGDIVFVGNGTPGHTFIFAERISGSTNYRYDGGSDWRISQVQPYAETGDDMSRFLYAYRPR